MSDEMYRERIAAVQHEIWSHWMRYLFSVCGELNDDGSATIPAYNVERWHRQMHTDYADLTDKERESDRDQADKVLAERDAEISDLRENLQIAQSALSESRRQVEELQATVKKLRAEIHAVDIPGVLDWTS